MGIEVFSSHNVKFLLKTFENIVIYHDVNSWDSALMTLEVKSTF